MIADLKWPVTSDLQGPAAVHGAAVQQPPAALAVVQLHAGCGDALLPLLPLQPCSRDAAAPQLAGPPAGSVSVRFWWLQSWMRSERRADRLACSPQVPWSPPQSWTGSPTFTLWLWISATSRRSSVVCWHRRDELPCTACRCCSTAPPWSSNRWRARPQRTTGRRW